MRDDTVQGFQLSPQQEHLWLLQQSDPRAPYQAVCAVLVNGDVDAGALEAALRQVVQRHEILRTAFRLLPGMALPLQVITPEAGLRAPCNGLGESLVEELGGGEIEKGTPLCAALATLSPGKHRLLLGLPALCADAETLKHLVAEIGRCYAARMGGEDVFEEPTQYADVAEWQNQVLSSEETLEGRRFWRRLLSRFGLDARLPFDRNSEDRSDFVPQSIVLPVAAALLPRLETLARRCNADVAAVLLGCWQVLLQRLTLQPSLIVGVACDGRRYEELKSALGLFAKYLPLPCDLPGETPFVDVPERLRAKLSDLEEWQEFFDWRRVAEWSGGEHAAFFPFCFDFAELPAGFTAAGATFAIDRWRVCIDRFRLRLSCLRDDGTLTTEVFYDAGELRREEVERLAGWYHALLENALEAPQSAVADLEVLSAAERRQLLHERNSTAVDFGAAATLAQLFAAQADRTPERVAVVFQDRELTYAELDRRAERLARRLRRLGVGLEVRVALGVERSLEMLVGMLGILKAGGAYVPLDPAYPRERLTFMLTDSQAPVLLTQEPLLAVFPAFSGRVLCLDRDEGEVAETVEDIAEPGGAAPENLAYVIYTSGSTGRPKGVMISHRAIANRLLWMQQVFPLGAGDCVLQKTPYSFDASIWEIFVPLFAGARLVVAEPGGHQDSAYLLATVAAQEVTTLQLVPSLLPVFLQQEGLRAGCRSLRRLFCGGEALPGRLQELFFARLDADLCNLYGPTEAAIDTTFHPCAPEGGDGVVPIGRPLANVQVYLLDDRWRPVPTGLAGELHIGGAGIARGYLGRPDLTAERFVPAPFGTLPGERLYRTGDLARWREDGSLEFLGRIDHQVKIRGFRIETGEIEAVLEQHPGVRETVVAARGETSGERYLVAYVVPSGRLEITGSRDGRLDDELRAFLAGRLPDYMVPPFFVQLESLPRLPNGKLDRGVLPEPESPGRRSQEISAVPRTLTEELLAGLWAELLPVREVGVHDDFFESGGHSLLATQMVSRIRELFRADVKVHHLFDAPTIAGLARELDALMQDNAGVGVPPIERAARDRDLPLSFAQQRLWFLDQLNLGLSAYNLPSAVRLEGRLSVPALARSLREVVRRHETLRTTFREVDGRPVQAIAATADTALRVVDLTALPAAEREVETGRLTVQEAWRAFDLARGPLLRGTLLRLDAEDHVAVLAMHHIVGDGWSTSLLIRELVTLFEAFNRGVASPLPELPIQYADYAVAQRRWLSGEVLETLLAYWKRQLAGDLPLLRLPFDRPRSASHTSRAGGFSTVYLQPLADGLKSLGRQEGSSLFMTLLAAFKAVLFHYTGQRDLLVGSPVANRNRRDVEALVGLFVNTLVLRTRVAGDPRVRELLGQVRATALDAYVHQEMPFDRLVDELQPERSLEHLPLFQVMFMLQNLPEAVIELPGLRVSATSLSSETAKFDLLVELHETAQGLFCSFEYKAELFDATTIVRLAAHLQNVLRDMVSGPERRLSALSLLADAERHQLLLEWNDSAAPYPCQRCIHELFEERARESPERPAVWFEGEEWSYGDLNRRANRLAHHLRSLGAGPGTLVAVYLERSAEMVSALLGVLKAGAAYVPLDVSYPAARIERLLSSLQIEHVITQASRLEDIASLADLPRLRHLICPSHLAGLAEDDPAPLATADDLAYIIFTSGSTGVPKGVMVRHRPVINLIHWLTRRFGVDASDRILFVTSLCFDLSVYDIFGILAAGGTVRVASESEVGDPESLLRILYREPITFWDTAPAALQQLTAFFPPPEATPESRLRRVFLSGDWIPLPLPDQVRRAFPAARVIALGGATEATVWSNCFPIGEIDPSWVSIPYGRPIDNAQYHILDEWLEPCTIGVEGDLYIGGECLYSGYTGDARENALKNVPDPFGGASGARLYRTGDRARFKPDGIIEFLGRADHQVKIRGFRIELGEIEAALCRHPAVREVVVLAREDSPGNKRLAAYVVGRGEAPDPGELRDHLRREVPEYMVPAALIALDALPVTANGKLDRSALPAPEAARYQPEQLLEPPRNPAEELLAAIWADVLDVPRVGVHDNFFELGGDSILTIQIVARARQAGLQLSPRDLFTHQTVAELTAAAGVAGAATGEQGPVTGPVPLTPVQRWLLEQELPDLHHFNQAVLLEVHRPLDAPLLERVVRQLLAHHDALRARFLREGSNWWQLFTPPGGETPTVWVDLAELPGLGQGPALEAAAAVLEASLDLAAGPLLRVALYDFGGGRPQRLLLIVHHLVVDGVSWRILLEDLFTVYAQLERGEAPALPPKSTSFAEWARHLEETARGGALEPERSYWLAQSQLQLPPLPLDLSRGDNIVASARAVSASLDAGETRALLQEVPQVHRAQIQDVLLSALARVFARWTGSPRLRIDLEGHGRETLRPDHDLSRTVGWFTTIFPLVLDADPSPGTTLKTVKEALRRVPQGGLGHGMLRYLGNAGEGDPVLSARPPEVVFNYLGQLDQALPRESRVGPARESAGATTSPRQVRRHVIEVSAGIAGGRLHLTWTYSENLHHGSTLQGLVQDYCEDLRALIAYCRGAETPAYTPSDFPLASLAGLDQAGLDRLCAEYGDLEDVYPMSPLQEGLLFHSLDPETASVYQQQLSCALSGDLDPAAFEHAWRRAIERHPTLRTAFAWEGIEQPLQVVRRGNVRLSFSHLDWRNLPESRWRPLLSAFVEESRRRLLPLSAAPLMRLTLVWLPAGAFHFVWDHHHLLLDGWSVARLVQEVFGLYGATRRGEPAELDAVPLYRDYIAWLQAQDREAAEVFWRRALAGFTEPVPVGGRQRVAVPPGAEIFRERRTELAVSTSAVAQSWIQRHRLTLATLIHGVWALLLARYSGRDDIVFGTVTSGRPPELSGVERILGLFISTLPVRVGIESQSPWTLWLDRLQSLQAESRQYEYSALAEIQGWSEVSPGLPLFESLLVFENFPVSEQVRDQGAGRIEVVSAEFMERSNYPLTLVAAPGAAIPLRLLYDIRRFEPADVERLLGHFQVLFESALAHPEQRLGEVPLLTPAERHQLLSEWNDTETPYPEGLCIHEMFEACVEERLERPAVVFQGAEWSYGELNRRANRLAHHLRSLGVGPGTLVAVYLERCAEMASALLGILKAGAAYVPLEVSYPAARIERLLSTLGVEYAVTQGSRLGALASAGDLPRLRHLISVRGEPPAGVGGTRRVWGPSHLSQLPAENPAPLAISEDLAYVIFTSGSTGIPKGVMVRHRPVINLIHWLTRRFGIGADDRILFVTSLCFDLSVYDLFGLLAAGGTVRVASEAEVGDPELLVRILYREPITFWDTAPAALQQLVPFFPPPAARPPSRLRWVLLSGDWIPLALPDQVRQAFPGAEVIALGGATEATVWSNYFPVGEVADSWVSIPYGRPIENARYYVLDAGLSPVPITVEGDLYIGGDCLYSGYTGDARENALKNVPDPFGGGAGARLYRTGDRARFRSDGTIEFLGRADHQVKIRGFRIELGEIEAALSRHPAVLEVVVTAREEAPGGKRLVAYVVADREKGLEIRELRDFLRGQLPDPLVPAAFVLLDALPVTPNGKLDRARLPAPVASAPEREDFAPPSSEAEVLLAEIWREVLRVDRVGLSSGFLELGGDSILSIQVVSRARRAGLQLSPRDLFEHQTLADLAAAATPTPRNETEQGPVSGPVPLTPIQHWFFEQDLVDAAHFNQALVLAVRRPVVSVLLARAMQALVDHHDALRLRFERRGTSWHQTHAEPGGEAPWIRVDLSDLPEGRRRPALESAASDLQAGLDLGRGPLLRMGLFDLADGEPQRLLLAAHHLVVDGVSWRILLEDLETAYQQVESGETPSLPPKTTSFKRWAERLTELASSEALEGETGYWLSLARAEVVPLPAEEPGGWNRVGSAQNVSVSLATEETRELLDRASRAYRTGIDDLLLVAAVEAFGRWTGSRRLLLDLEGHGREDLGGDLDVSRTVGWFTSLFPLLLDLTGVTEPGAAIQAVKRQRRAVPRRGIGYGLLRYLGAGEVARELAAAWPQVVFNYLGQLDQALSGDGLFAASGESAGAARSPRQSRRHLLEVNAYVAAGRLHLAWTYSPAVHRQDTVERLAADYLEALRSVIDHCLSAGLAGYTPADFPAAALSQEQLDRILAAVGPALARARDAGTVEAIYPLSAAQEGMLYETLSPRQAGLHVEQWSCVLRGDLDLETLERAWMRVVRRHAILRTGFVWQDLEEPLQFVVGGDLPLPVATLDWRDLPPEAQERELAVFLAGDGGRGFDLLRPPLLRIALLRLADDAVRLVWTHHHILLDGWCRPLVLREVMLVYDVLRQGRGLDLRPSPPYGDYIDWLRRQDLARAEDYWRRSLAGFVRPTPLGREEGFSPGGPGGERFQQLSTSLDAAETAALQAMALRYRLTQNTLLQAAWALLLSRYSGQEDVVFGITVAGRPAELAGIETTIGPFINTLPLRVRIAPAHSLVSWLQALQADNLDLRQYEHTPGGKIRAWSEVPAAYPLYDSLLVFEGLAAPEAAAAVDATGGLTVADVRMAGARTHCALTLLVEPGPALVLRLVVDRHRVQAEDAPRVLDHLRTLLPRLAAEPERRLASVLEDLAGVEVPRVASRHTDRSRAADGTFAAPRTPTEKLLAGVWCEVLGLESVSRNDDFFVLGGHSLVATQVISRVRQLFRLELPLRTVFDAPTLAGMAAKVDAAAAQDGPAAAVPLIERVPRDGELPLSFAQQRLWFLEHFDPGKSTFNIPLAVSLQGPLDVASLEHALSEVVRRHETLRTTFSAADGVPFQVIARHRPLTLPLLALDSLPAADHGAALRRLVDAESRRLFDLARGPLLRVCLLRLDAREHVLLLTVHHILSDAWSAAVLVREMAALYSAFCAGEPSPLPELEIQYADFAVWQRRWLQREVTASHLAYWRRQLAGDLPVVELSGDRPRPEVQSFRGGNLAVELPADLGDSLRALSRREGVTLFMILLAAFKVLLRHHTSQDDIIVGTDVANRNRLETEGLIGFFVNQLPLRTRMSGNPTFRELLGRVKEVTLGAYAHQDLPFEQLVDALSPQRSLKYAPLFQVKLFVTEGEGIVPASAGLALGSLDVDVGAAQLDLTLSFREARKGPVAGLANYNTDLFDVSTVMDLMVCFERLLAHALMQPDARLSDLDEFLSEVHRQQRTPQTARRGERNLQRFRSVQPQAVPLARGGVTEAAHLSPGPTSPPENA